MKTVIVAIANQKGGSGKSTLEMCLSASLCSRGKKVLVVDGDGQGSASSWAQSAGGKQPFPAMVTNLSSSAERLHQALFQHVGNYDFILVDCPPSVDAPLASSAFLVSDLVLVPVQPTPTDIWAARSMTTLIERAQAINPGLRAAIVVNRMQHTRLAKITLAELRNFGIPLLNTCLYSRTAYQEAALHGTSPLAMGAGARQAASEIHALTDEVLEILGDEQHEKY